MDLTLGHLINYQYILGIIIRHLLMTKIDHWEVLSVICFLGSILKCLIFFEIYQSALILKWDAHAILCQMFRISRNTWNFILHIITFIYFMGYRQKLINTWISRIKPELVWGGKVVFIEKIIYTFVKQTLR